VYKLHYATGWPQPMLRYRHVVTGTGQALEPVRLALIICLPYVKVPCHSPTAWQWAANGSRSS
jgi:hypothetical protein